MKIKVSLEDSKIADQKNKCTVMFSLAKDFTGLAE